MRAFEKLPIKPRRHTTNCRRDAADVETSQSARAATAILPLGDVERYLGLRCPMPRIDRQLPAARAALAARPSDRVG